MDPRPLSTHVALTRPMGQRSNRTFLFLISQKNYLLFHSLVEFISIIIAYSIFTLYWNTRHLSSNNITLFLGVAYLFIASVDLLHTLAYKGMGVFAGDSANLTTQLCIAARILEAVALLIAPIFIGRPIKEWALIAAFGLVFSLLMGTIFVWHIFPDCYIDGIGLTPFKKIAEYIISLMLLLALLFLFRNHAKLEPVIVRYFVWSILLTIASELAFTFYVDVYGFSNLVGHYFKLLSFNLMYKAFSGFARAVCNSISRLEKERTGATGKYGGSRKSTMRIKGNP